MVTSVNNTWLYPGKNNRKLLKLKGSEVYSLFHSVLNCIYPGYQTSDKVEREILVTNFREDITRHLLQESNLSSEKVKENIFKPGILNLADNILESTIDDKFVFDRKSREILKQNSNFLVFDNGVLALKESPYKVLKSLSEPFLENFKNIYHIICHLFEINMFILTDKKTDTLIEDRVFIDNSYPTILLFREGQNFFPGAIFDSKNIHTVFFPDSDQDILDSLEIFYESDISEIFEEKTVFLSLEKYIKFNPYNILKCLKR